MIRSDRWRWVSALLLTSVVVLVVVLLAGGGAPQPVPAGLPDAGPVTGWLLPGSRLLADLSGTVTIGFLMAPGLLLPSRADVLTRPGFASTRAAVRTSLVWAVAVVVELVLTVSDILGMRPGKALDSTVLRSFVSQLPEGRVLLAQALLALVVGVVARSALTSSRAFLATCLAAVTMALPTLTGHSAASGQHELAIASLMVHVVSAALWMGGLLGLLWVAVMPSRTEEARQDRESLGYGLARFSNLALVCWISVGLSGVVNAALRLGPADLVGSSYGVLVLCKATMLAVLGGFGWWHRQHTVRQLRHDDARARPLFVRVAAMELLVMGATFGLAVGLSRTPTPAGGPVDTSPAFERLGFDLPAAPDLWRLLGSLTHDGFALVLIEVAALSYAFGVRALQRRREPWPGGRTLAWYAGLVVAGWATIGGLGLYAHVLFSVHLAAEMLLGVVVPVLLVLGSPLTLALRTLPGRRIPRERGLRQLLQLVLDSRVVGTLGRPPVAGALFVASLFLLYLTPLFGSLMAQHLGHSLMQLWLLALGCLLTWSVVGGDSAPRVSSAALRVGTVVLVAVLLGLFAVVTAQSRRVLARDYFTDLHRRYSPDLLADQHHGALAVWGLGVAPLVLLAVVLTSRSRRRDAHPTPAPTTDPAPTAGGHP